MSEVHEQRVRDGLEALKTLEGNYRETLKALEKEHKRVVGTARWQLEVDRAAAEYHRRRDPLWAIAESRFSRLREDTNENRRPILDEFEDAERPYKKAFDRRLKEIGPKPE